MKHDRNEIVFKLSCNDIPDPEKRRECRNAIALLLAVLAEKYQAIYGPEENKYIVSLA